ncbi:GrpB family protein [Paraliobacillus sp. PM-2]|uniref:GrpB family protein n=1 Tax=Paraliobacillus sp. PM-2 TaxID=1462524 RepID=UPI000B88008B|nr:GrpB family protein [Paraliobacillus sp. PM-2]
MRKVEVTSFNKSWSSMFEQEANKLYKIFGSEIIKIHHIGSTSVIGLKAKPIIDIMLVVKNINQVDGFTTAMTTIGYESKGENGISGRRFFQKGGDNRTHHVHIFELGNVEIEHHLAFRNYLRSHPDTAKAYGELKEALSQRFPYDIEAYIHGKEQLVSEIKNRAIDWYEDI